MTMAVIRTLADSDLTGSSSLSSSGNKAGAGAGAGVGVDARTAGGEHGITKLTALLSDVARGTAPFPSKPPTFQGNPFGNPFGNPWARVLIHW